MEEKVFYSWAIHAEINCVGLSAKNLMCPSVGFLWQWDRCYSIKNNKGFDVYFLESLVFMMSNNYWYLWFLEFFFFFKMKSVWSMKGLSLLKSMLLLTPERKWKSKNLFVTSSRKTHIFYAGGNCVSEKNWVCHKILSGIFLMLKT